MKTITKYQLYRSHSSNTNYLTIVQTKSIKFDYENGVKYCPIRGLEILKRYDVDEIKKDNSEDAEQNLINYLKNDIFNKDNVATKGYKFFRIVLSNKEEIICTSFKSFLDEYTIPAN